MIKKVLLLMLGVVLFSGCVMEEKYMCIEHPNLTFIYEGNNVTLPEGITQLKVEMSDEPCTEGVRIPLTQEQIKSLVEAQK